MLIIRVLNIDIKLPTGLYHPPNSSIDSIRVPAKAGIDVSQFQVGLINTPPHIQIPVFIRRAIASPDDDITNLTDILHLLAVSHRTKGQV
jgi:hypothetical protein